MKKILMIMLMAVLLLSGCAVGENREEGNTQTESENKKEESDNSETEDEEEESQEDESVKIDEENYKEAYYEIIKEYTNEHSNSECVFDLIFVNDDNIPELVAGVSGYYVSLYTYKNDEVYTLMDDWGYGAAGNSGYDYLPYANVVCNTNADQAGAVVYYTYWFINDNMELEEYYDKALYAQAYEDEDHDGMPDDGQYLDDYIYYYGDQRLTEEEFEKYTFKGERDGIWGALEYQEILTRLGITEEMTLKDVDAEIEAIRDYYYWVQDNIDELLYGGHADNVDAYYDGPYAAKVVVPVGYDGADYERNYYFKDKKLIFAFVFYGGEEYRFYFKDDQLIRYIDSESVTYNYNAFPDIMNEVKALQEEAYGLESTMVNCGN